jgi:hypothetical protein
MTVQPISTKWQLGHDRYGRRVTLTRKGNDFEMEIEPCSQRDDGERIWSLSRDLLIAAGDIAKEQR